MGSVFFKTKKEKLSSTAHSLWEIKARHIDGETFYLGDLAKDKKCIMFVNVASN